MSVHAPFVLYGGTFDPVHHGHLAIARAARDALRTDIRLMPAADPPHRAPPGATAAQRADMLRLAIAGEPGLLLDERELRRGEPSRSVDTLRALRGEIGDRVPVALLVGADSFAGLPQWKAWRELFDLAHFVVASRAGSDPEQTLDPALGEALAGRVVDDPGALRLAPAGRVLYLRQPLHPQSASAIRAAIAAGDDWRGLVPAAVAGYIARHGLYRGGGVNGAVAGPQV